MILNLKSNVKFKFLNLILLSLLLSACDDNNNKSNFTVTPDTIIEPNSEISKYVTQDEVDSFSFRCADIVCDEEKNATLKPLRIALDSKDTKAVIKFIKDKNLSADIRLRDKRTPLMYSSFRNDVNTTKELISLGANLRAKDAYELTPMAYAIMLGSANTAKVLLDNGVEFEEVEFIAPYIIRHWFEEIDKIIIDGDNLEIIYQDKYLDTNTTNPQCYKHCDHDKNYGIFAEAVRKNNISIAKLMLESGYKPTIYYGDMFRKQTNNYDDIIPKEQQKEAIENGRIENDKFSATHYKFLIDMPNHEPMLNLLLDYNVSGQPSKEFLKSEYDECYEDYIWMVREYIYFLYNELKGIDKEKERKLREEYSKKKKYKKYNGDFNFMTEALIRDGIIVRISQKPDEKRVKYFKNKMNFYKKHCVKDKEFIVESLLDINSSSPFEKLREFEKTKLDENTSFKGVKEFINYKNEYNKNYAIDMITYRNPEKVYLKDKNMTLKEFQDIEYEKYLNENRGKNGKKLK